MSFRGGGKGGKGSGRGSGSGIRPQSRPTLSEEAKSVLLMKHREEPPPELFPTIPEDRFPKPPVVHVKDKSLINKQRFLSDFFRYSGYYQVGDERTQNVERYSDRYRRIEGQRGLFDEIVEPSLKIFPADLLKGMPKKPPTIHNSSVVQYLTSSSFNQAYSTKHREDTVIPQGLKAMLEKEEDGSSEEEEQPEEELFLDNDEEDDLGGGDYTQQYDDMEEEDDRAFGDEDEATM